MVRLLSSGGRAILAVKLSKVTLIETIVSGSLDREFPAIKTDNSSEVKPIDTKVVDNRKLQVLSLQGIERNERPSLQALWGFTLVGLMLLTESPPWPGCFLQCRAASGGHSRMDFLWLRYHRNIFQALTIEKCIHGPIRSDHQNDLNCRSVAGHI